jgi:uncharacterized membrane protein
MTRLDARQDVARWVEQGRLDRARLREALARTGAVPSPAEWRRFLANALLWLACVALAASLGFFVAANWQALGRFGKLALVEAWLVAMLTVVAWRGLDSPWGRAAILAAALAVGTLLAFVGQTYQTGADAFELFAVWALAILPWVLVARQAALVLVWIAVADLAAWLYAGLAISGWQLLFGARAGLWSVAAIHAVALVLWELAIARGIAWLDARYAVRLVAAGLGGVVTALVVDGVMDGPHEGARVAAAAAYAVVLGALYVRYRVHRVDLFVLAGCVLSAIVVGTTVALRIGLVDGIGGFLTLGLLIAGASAVGAQWLRRVAREAA